PTQHTGPAAAVHADHHRGLGVGVLRASLGPRSRPLSGADLDVGLVVVAWPQTLGPNMFDSNMPAHSCAKAGSCLLVAPMSSISTPSTRSPTIAPAIAIR